MKKLFITCALVFSSGSTLAATAEQPMTVSGTVQFGQTTELKGDLRTVGGLPAGATDNGTLIATVGVTGGGSYWLIGIDPNDTTSAGNAPDQGWIMKSESTPTKLVKVKISNENRVDYQPNLGAGNFKWNRMRADQRANIIVNGKQNVDAGDDYRLTVNIAKYVP